MASSSPSRKPQSQMQVPSTQLKRATCNLCRERKVRCDREKPQCQRCRKSGQTCVYPSDKTDNNEIKSALNLLHSRLLQAEMTLQEQGLQFTTPSMKLNHSVSSSYMSQESQFVNDLLSQGDQIDYSNMLPAMSNIVNSSVTDGTPSDLDLNMTDLKDNPPGPTFNPFFEHPTPFSGMELQYVPHYNKIMKLSSKAVSCRYQPYFDIVQKHIMLIDQREFLRSVVPMKTHQCMSLKYATALSGSTACGETALAMESYIAARFHLERAENLADNSTFLNLETVQALLLVARFEFIHISGPKGLLTIARATQLLSLLGYDVLDRTSSEGEQNSSHVMPPKSHSPGCIQMIRRTFWIAFAMHCNAAASFACCIPVRDSGIGTAMPVPNPMTDSDLKQHVYLSDGITNTITKGLSVFSLFIFAMKLVVDGDRHRQATNKYVQDKASDYNFCLVHEKIGTEIKLMSKFLSEQEFLDGPDDELRVLTCIVVIGTRIDWLKTAIIGSLKAAFLGPIAKEYRTSCVAVTNAMCDLLLQANFTDAKQIPAYKEMSLFIMRPLALAAEFQLEVLQNPQDMSYNAFSSTREIRQNLELLCNVMVVCKPATGEYDRRIQACTAFLEKTRFERVLNSSLLGNGVGR
ncbi:uncharacterized protein N7500_006600 [Penicillium coprophilum]|uniref:uncharacterized protein n=1 Tax=Penicillium coprophilum TaxID=36646 RepID=UPI0023845920|nr:uncharacterized protein N7500_006600 [Penicillium coprophilum]KAJ5164770.1 hypothetical protein N7500_006600 [Penicillium coprophilum]